MTVAEQDRKSRILKIQELLNEGYPASRIKNLLGITYNTIRKYKDGDPDLLCRAPERQIMGGAIDGYKELILEGLNSKKMLKEILREINKTDVSVKKTTFYDYCNKLKIEYGINTKVNTAGIELNLETFKTRFIKRNDLLKYLWTGEGLTDADYMIVREKYEAIQYLENFVYDFRSVFADNKIVMLTGFLEIYEGSAYSKIKSFVNGLSMDLDAVANAVALPYSNGFVEGNNNRIKMIKRTMYGRAKLPLLRAKILYGR